MNFVDPSFKASVTPAASRGGIWQRGYHERVIRDDREWNDTREYILANPGRWPEDEEFVVAGHAQEVASLRPTAVQISGSGNDKGGRHVWRPYGNIRILGDHLSRS